MRFLLLFAAAAATAFAQPYPTNAAPPGSALHSELAAFDARLFEAVNTCRLDAFEAMFDEGIEFYHDQGGLTVGAAKVTAQVKANICGKARRELVAGSLTVYPMKDYGALLVGRHRFYPAAPGAQPTGIAQFAHLVRKQPNGTWKITRVLSFDHAGLDR